MNDRGRVLDGGLQLADRLLVELNLTPQRNNFPIHPGQQIDAEVRRVRCQTDARSGSGSDRSARASSALGRIGQLDNVVVIYVHPPRGPTLVAVAGFAEQGGIARAFVHKGRTGCGTQHARSSKKKTGNGVWEREREETKREKLFHLLFFCVSEKFENSKLCKTRCKN